MKKAFYCFLLLVISGSFSCKKAIQHIEEDYVTSIMTKGHWYVAQYLEASVDITPSFAGYEFQFYADGKVDGLKGANTEKGIWAADVNTLSITSSFPTSGAPLNKLNGTWKIVDTDPTYVKANSTINGSSNFLYLKKVP